MPLFVYSFLWSFNVFFLAWLTLPMVYGDAGAQGPGDCHQRLLHPRGACVQGGNLLLLKWAFCVCVSVSVLFFIDVSKIVDLFFCATLRCSVLVVPCRGGSILSVAPSTFIVPPRGGGGGRHLRLRRVMARAFFGWPGVVRHRTTIILSLMLPPISFDLVRLKMGLLSLMLSLISY